MIKQILILIALAAVAYFITTSALPCGVKQAMTLFIGVFLGWDFARK